ncbi:hypothetical protein HYS50_01675 [Candidatus Woesearchaeota archaeon]|nr:hypothetical protein [Candidatus Woesearchaeota archaeon]
MRHLKEWARKSLVTLTAVLSSCTQIPIPPYQETTTTKPASQPASRPATGYEFSLTPLAKYNPTIQRNRLQISDRLRVYLENGIDYVDNLLEDHIKIQDPLKFRELIYSEALKVGYNKEQVIDLSPQQTIELCNKIIANRVNYFGTTHDFQSRTKRDQVLRRLKKGLEQVLIDPLAPEKQKQDATEKLGIMKQLEESIKKQDSYEDKLSNPNMFLSGKQDDEPVDLIFEREEEIICRHYAKIEKGIFFMLQIDNQKLKNTYIATYIGDIPKRDQTTVKHCWNQIATVWKELGRVHVGITFSDPTWFDVGGDGDGFDWRHFRDATAHNEQLRKIKERVEEELKPASQPTTMSK